MTIFDIIGPIIIGPSSSHTAGAAKIGNFARKIYNDNFKRVKITLYNSFAKTGKGHGTDKAILGGVLGFNIDDNRILKSFEIAKKRKIKFKFRYKYDETKPPNSAKINFCKGKTKFSITGISTGGGRVVIRQINHFKVHFRGKYPVLIIMHKDVVGMVAFISQILTDLKLNIAFMDIKRSTDDDNALTVIKLDTEFPEKHLSEFYKDKNILKVINIERLEDTK